MLLFNFLRNWHSPFSSAGHKDSSFISVSSGLQSLSVPLLTAALLLGMKGKCRPFSHRKFKVAAMKIPTLAVVVGHTVFTGLPSFVQLCYMYSFMCVYEPQRHEEGR